MKSLYIIITFLIFICTRNIGQTDSARVYGEVNKDFNRSSKLIKLPGGNLIWVGEWNNDGIIMKIAPDGKEISRLILTNGAGTIVRINDAITDNDNTIVVAGDCEKCVAEDTLPRVILFRIDTLLSGIKNKSLILGTNKTNKLIYNPSLAVNKNRLMLVASQAGEGSNFEDLYLAAINTKLDTIWTKSINSCANCRYEYPVRMTATGSGFATFAYHDFTDTATIYHFDENGNTLWRLRSFTWNGVAGGAISYYNNKIYIGVGVRGLPQDPFYFVATVLGIDEKLGIIVGSTSLNDPFTDRAIVSLDFAKNGILIVGYLREVPSFNGSYLSSQLLRLDFSGATAKFIDARLIPNPTDQIDMRVIHALPLNDDGSRIGAIGVRGGSFNRTFYYSSIATPTVSNKEIIIHSKFTIYPNPVSENQSFSISIPAHWNKTNRSTILIYNQTGQLINQYYKTFTDSQYTLTGLQKGWYTLVIKNDNSIMTNKLIVY